jgi:hypothetical protein
MLTVETAVFGFRALTADTSLARSILLNDHVKDPLNDYTRWKIALYEYDRLLNTCGPGGRRGPTRTDKEHFFAEYGMAPPHG